MSNVKNLIEINNVTLNFETAKQTVTAVKSANSVIPKGKVTIIFGPSGSGKSSLLNMLSGLQAPTTGSIKYDKVDIYKKSSNEIALFRAHELGIVYQTNYWVKSLNVTENVSLPLYFLGHSKDEANIKAKDALRQINMQEFAEANPSLLSGGEQQRIAMARALVYDPPVIVADEPTGNLDSKNGDMIINLLNDLKNNQGKTIILVTHNIEYLYLADHLIEIQDGQVFEIDKAEIKKTVSRMLTDSKSRINKLMDNKA